MYSVVLTSQPHSAMVEVEPPAVLPHDGLTDSVCLCPRSPPMKKEYSLFTKKQLWRRTRSLSSATSSRNNSITSFFSSPSSSFHKSSSTSSLSSNSSVETVKSSIEGGDCCEILPRSFTHRNGDQSNSTTAAATCRPSVKFDNKQRIILVPARLDYLNAQLHTELWWQPCDYFHFKSSAKEEVEEMMKRHDLDLKSAMALLFSSTSSATSPTSTTAPPDSPLSSQPADAAMMSPSTVARRPSVGTLPTSAESAGHAINFLEIRGGHHLLHEDKPIHPLAFLAS